MLRQNKLVNLLALLVCLLIGSDVLAFSGATHVLPSGKWNQITLPCKPSVAKQTVADIFGDDLPGTYGIDWVLFGFDETSASSESIQENTVLEQNRAYWIIQQSGADKILDMPADCQTPSLSTSSACASPHGCFEFSLASAAYQKVWNMVGYPFDVANDADNVRVVTDASASNNGCPSGCDLATAKANKLVHDRFAHFNGVDYTPIGSNSTFQPWQGFWVASLGNSYGLNPRLLIPAPEPPAPVGRALLGPLSGATFTLQRLGVVQPVYQGLTSQGNGSDIATAGLIAVPDSITNQLADGLYQLTITGGSDIDADDNKAWDATPTVNTGSIHSILSAQQIKNRDFNVNILTELVYQDIKDKVDAVATGLATETEITQKIENNVGYLLDLASDGDINGDNAIDADDLIKWNPADDQDKLKGIDYASQIEPIISKVHQNQDIRTEARYFFNKPPVANAGSNRTVAQNESIRLDGSSSQDADGSIIAYEWRYNSQVVSSDAIFTLNPLPVGTHVVNLTVTDDDGARDDQSVTIAVSDAEECNGVETQEGYIEVTLAWTDANLNMNLSTDLSQQVGSFDIKDTDCLLEHYFVPVGADIIPGSYPVKVAYTGSTGNKDELSTIVTIKVPGSNQSRMVSLNLLDSLADGKIADIVISTAGVEFVPVDDFEREAVVLYNRTENSETYLQAFSQTSAGSQTSSTEHSSGWSGQLPQQGYNNNTLYDVIWNISQAILGGSLAGAQVDLFAADGYDTVLDDGSTPLYTTTASYGSSAYTAGIIIVPTSIRNALQDDQLYIVRVRGGADIDPDADQQINGVANSQANLHALLTGKELKTLGFKVNILTEFAYQLGKDLLADRTALRSRINQTSRCLLGSDMNADGAVNHLDALVWTPNGNTGKLFRPYHDNFVPIMNKMRNGENVYADMFNLAAKPLLEAGNFTIQEDLAANSTIGQIKTFCALEQPPTAYQIRGTGAENFRIDGNGVLSLAATANLDYEAQRLYTLYVTGSNDYGESLPVTVYVTVTADGSPLLGTLESFVTEGAEAGTAIGTLSVDTGDTPVTGIRLEGYGAGNFAVSPAGAVTVAAGAQFNHATTPNYTLQAIATNAAGDSGPSQVKIKVYDDIPTLTSPFYARIREDIPGGTRIGRLGHYPGLSPISAFTVNGVGAERFTLDTDGYIHMAGNATDKPIENDNISTYRLQVTAANAQGNSASVDMRIDVVQSSDTNALVVRDFSTDVFINTPNNTAIGIIGYTYALQPASVFTLSGNDAAGFGIAADGTLILTNNTVLNGKAGQTLSFTVTANNAYGATSEAAPITVHIKDDVPTLYPMSSSILEGSPAGTKVGKLGYSYGISPINQFTLTGEGVEHFALDNNGLMTVAEGATLSHSSKATYNLTAQATNTVGGTASTSVSIAVYSSVPTLRDSSVAVMENSAVGERVALVPVVTIGNSAITGFTLSGSGSEAFAVDAQGYVTVANNSTLDAEQINGFNLQVTATNAQGTSEPVALTITLTDIPDGAVPTVNAGEDQSVIRDETVTLTAVATDSDGSIASYAWKQGGTVLSTASSFTKNDFAVGTHTITLTVTDDDGNQVSDTVTVNVLDDSTAPVITLTGDSVMIIQVGGSYTELGATATDTIDGNVNVSISGSVNTATAGDYTVTYRAVDGAGNVTTKTRLVKVISGAVVELGAVSSNVLGTPAEHVEISPDGSKAFVSGGTSVGGNKLVILDISDSQNPSIIGSLSTTYSISSLALTHDATKVLLGTEEGNVEVIDVRNPQQPSHIGGYDTQNPAGYKLTDIEISADDTKAFVTSYLSGFHILDITTDNPSRIHFYNEAPYIHLNAVEISDDESTAYLYDHDDKIISLDISDLSVAPVFINQFSHYQSLDNAFGGKKQVVLSGSAGMIYVMSRTDSLSGTSNYNQFISIIDVQDIDSMSFVKSHYLSSPERSGGGLSGIVLSADNESLIISNGEKGFELIDIHDPVNPVSLISFDTSGSVYDAKPSADGKLLYIADAYGGFKIYGLAQAYWLNGE